MGDDVLIDQFNEQSYYNDSRKYSSHHNAKTPLVRASGDKDAPTVIT